MAYIMIEWVNDYHGRLPGLNKSQKNAEGFLNTISQHGGRKAFNYGNDLAWDSDWEARYDKYYAEAVSMAYFSGHGNTTGPLFGKQTQDDGIAFYKNVSLGEKNNLKCVVFDAGNVLKYSYRWRSAMRGLRHILGFSKNGSDKEDRGKEMANYMGSGRISIGDCWFRACMITWSHLDSRPTWIFADYADQTPNTQSFKEKWNKGFRASNETTPRAINVTTSF